MIRPGVPRLFRLALQRLGALPAELDEEIELHLELRARQLVAQGLAPAAARAEALRRFGNPAARRALRRQAQRKEFRMRLRDAIGALVMDVRYSLRGFRREPLFTGFVLVTLALGIGSNAAMFGVADRLLLRGPAHIREPATLKRLLIATSEPTAGERRSGYFPYAGYLAARDARELAGIAGYAPGEFLLQGDGATERVPGSFVTASFFPLLGVQPALGRFFTAGEDDIAAPERVVVLGYGLWRRAFAGDSAVLGSSVLIEGRPHRIVGVAPRGFTGVGLARVDLWRPASLRGIESGPAWTTRWNNFWLQVVARVAPGSTPAAAQQAATRLYRERYTGRNEAMRQAELVLAPASFDPSGKQPAEGAILPWLLGVVAAVLLIACSNVSNLLLARGIRRRGELAVRMALGAGRGRVVRLVTTEALLLTLGGGALGLGVAQLTGTLLRRTLVPDADWPASPLGATVLLGALGVALVSGIAIALLPAYRASRPDLTEALKTGVGSGKGRRSRGRAVLTVAQVALSVLLLAGAGLFLESLRRVAALDLGFHPERALSIQAWRPRPPGGERDWAAELQRERQFAEAALVRLQALPGVEYAAQASSLPLESATTVRLQLPGGDSIPGLAGGGPYVTAVSADYFAAVGTPLLRGRVFSAADRAGSPRVVIVSRRMAETLWPGRNPLGECLQIGDTQPAPCYGVVGVVADVHRWRIREAPSLSYYVPLGQEVGFSGSNLLVRPRGDLASVPGEIRAALQALDPGIGYLKITTLEQHLNPEMRPWRIGAAMFTLCGVLALVVAAIGLYSVISYLAASRTHEIGVRLALGATGGDVLRLVVGSGMLLAAVGVAAGLAAAVIGGRWLEPVLFETRGRDPVVLSVVVTTMLLVSLLACLAPGRRAQAVAPMEALRSE